MWEIDVGAWAGGGARAEGGVHLDRVKTQAHRLLNALEDQVMASSARHALEPVGPQSVQADVHQIQSCPYRTG